MAKRITLNKEEEIELTEREQEIYDKGFEDGEEVFDWSTFFLGWSFGSLLLMLLYAISK